MRNAPPPIGDRPVTSRTADAGGTERSYSIIGNDLTIVGQGLRIITKGTLQVDGFVEGDVVGNEVIIGEKGRVTGVVSGDSVEVRGAVSGTVKAMTVMLRESARVAGDVHHRQLTVEQGAHLDGRVRRPEDTNELKPVFE
ncbi:MAG: polymer-forming cytoskeletal protein [Hyphomicrobiaceae bacterium]|nr:polymer-forming cytoskeletal protein [Hyphomicrobiaceae bacterium]